MTYEDLGYNPEIAHYRNSENLASFGVGRIISEHKDRYVLKTPTSELEAELLGTMRFTAEDRYDLPAVGDWVAFSEYDEDKALVHAIFPRTTILERQAVGKKGQVQIIATNIDYGLIVQAADRDFNLNRLERYLTICNAAKVESIVVLSKIDLLDSTELASLLLQIEARAKDLEIITVSNQFPDGYDALRAVFQKGKTYCLLGSSGVGKSTLLNHISGKQLMETSHISDSVNKGRHTTSHRELFVLPQGGVLIDNPGMRELGITDASGGLETTFETILQYADDCRFSDCTHMHEKGCAVLAALDAGEIDEAAYTNFKKMEKEKAFFESDAQARKKKDKDLGKLIKNFKKKRKNDKY